MLNNYSIEQVKSFKSPGIVFSCEMPREYVAQKPRELLQHCNHPKLKGPYLSLLHANRTQPKLEQSCYSESSLPIQLFLVQTKSLTPRTPSSYLHTPSSMDLPYVQAISNPQTPKYTVGRTFSLAQFKARSMVLG